MSRTSTAPRSLPRSAPTPPNAVAATAPAESTATENRPIGVSICVKWKVGARVMGGAG